MGKYSVSAVLAVLTLATTAQAGAEELDEKQACVAAADEGQQLRDEGKYRRAQEAFMRCARPSCPEVVARDCSEWLLDLGRRAATVVITAKDDRGNDLADVKVTVDGEPLMERLDGKPMAVDPGEHLFVYEASAFPAVEQRILITAGQKNRMLAVRFEREGASFPAGESRVVTANGKPSIPLPTWIFGGTAIAAFASATYFGLSGISQRSDALGSGGCAPNCPSSEKSSVRTKFLVADISLGVGVVAAGLATYFFLRPRESNAPSSAALNIAPHATGGVATLSGHF
jgi:hypothetical protein